MSCQNSRVRPPHEPTEPEIFAELERILGDSRFQSSHQLSAFLRFAVQETLAGRSGQLKEHVIGVEVLKRLATYSPREDPAVRIMAGRLRSKLAEYYQESGQSDPVVIALPRGGYVPIFERRDPALNLERALKEANLADNISGVRKALGEDEKGEQLIETVPKRGYGFVAPVSRVNEYEMNFPHFLGSAGRTVRWRLPALVGLLASIIVGGGLWLYGRLERGARVQELVFAGDFYTKKWTEPEVRKAIEHFNRALVLNPKSSGAYAGLATAWFFLSDMHAPPRVAMPHAKAAALTALQLNNTSVGNYVTLAVISVQYDWDWQKAQVEFKRALQIDPHHVPAHALYGSYLVAMGRPKEGAAQIKRALDIDPLSNVSLWQLGLADHFAQRVDEAIEQYQRAIAVEPRSHWSHMFLGWALAEKARFQEAIAEVNQALRLNDDAQTMASLGYVYALAGQHKDAHRVLGELQETTKRRYVSPYDVAAIYAALRDNEQALHWLEKAYEDRSGWLAWWLKVDPRFDRLRSEQTFQNLLRRVGHTL